MSFFASIVNIVSKKNETFFCCLCFSVFCKAGYSSKCVHSPVGGFCWNWSLWWSNYPLEPHPAFLYKYLPVEELSDTDISKELMSVEPETIAYLKVT